MGWLLLGSTFLGLYAFATFSRAGATWGLHSLAYFPLVVRMAGVSVACALLCPPVQRKVVGGLRTLLLPFLERSHRGRWLLVALGSLAFVVFYRFPIRTDVYGDARTILLWYADNRVLPTEWLPRILDVHLLASKEVLTLLLHRTLAHLLVIPIRDAYRILSAVSGALCVCLWLVFLRRDASPSRWGPLLITVGCVLGSHQIFFGHVENYPFVFLTSLAFLVTGSLAFEGKTSVWTALLLFVFTVKAHAVTIYFLPALLVLLGYRLGLRNASIRRLVSWTRLAGWLIVPSLLVGAYLYFFYFRSYHEPPTGLGRAFEQTFLPIIPGPTPLDRYSLLSLNHLLDLGNVILLVGTPIVVALLGLLVLHPKAVDWHHPRVIFATLALGYPVLFFLALNPALSMPRDWDVYSLLGASLLLFFATTLAYGDDRIPSAPTYGTALAFGVFSVGFFALNASPSRLSLHLEDVGEHVFRTYHANAGYLIDSAQSMEPDSVRALARRLATARRLAPAAVGEDGEYTHLLVSLASGYRQQGDRKDAIAWMERAAAIAPHDVNLALWLSDYYLWARETEKAKQRIAALLKMDPRNVNALVQGAAADAQQRNFEGALAYLERARAVAPGDPDIASWTEHVKRRQRHSPERGRVPVVARRE